MIKVYYKNAELDRACREKRLTGALICFNTGIHESRFSKILNGRIEPTSDEKTKIAKILDCPVKKIFTT